MASSYNMQIIQLLFVVVPPKLLSRLLCALSSHWYSSGFYRVRWKFILENLLLSGLQPKLLYTVDLSSYRYLLIMLSWMWLWSRSACGVFLMVVCHGLIMLLMCIIKCHNICICLASTDLLTAVWWRCS